MHNQCDANRGTASSQDKSQPLRSAITMFFFCFGRESMLANMSSLEFTEVAPRSLNAFLNTGRGNSRHRPGNIIYPLERGDLWRSKPGNALHNMKTLYVQHFPCVDGTKMTPVPETDKHRVETDEKTKHIVYTTSKIRRLCGKACFRLARIQRQHYFFLVCIVQLYY